MKIFANHALLALVLAISLSAQAQTPLQPPASAPAENAAPAEIVPPKPPTPAGTAQPVVEVPDRASPLSPGSRAPQEPSPRSVHDAVDALSPGDLDQVLTSLKERYVHPASVADPEIKRATVQGLFDRLGPGATLIARAAAKPESSPFRSEVLEARTGYLRLGSLDPVQLGELDAALKGFSDQKLGSLIIDLRALHPETDLDRVAEVCRRFVNKGKVMFSVRRRDAKEQIFTSKDDPQFRGLLVVLVSENTAGNGEIIASVLRGHASAMVIGEKTRGEAAEFAELPLGKNYTLRLATSEVIGPDNQALFRTGLKPDLTVDVTPEATTAVLKQELEGGVGPLVFETERPRMNEAALVAGINPELEALQARARGEKPKPVLRDTTLQRALDFVTTVTIYEKGTRGRK